MRKLFLSGLFLSSMFVFAGCESEPTEAIDVTKDEIAEYEAMLAEEDAETAIAEAAAEEDY